MGRPIKKHWFGPNTGTGNQIVVTGVKFADGTTASSAFIVKQAGTTLYTVQDSAQTHVAERVFLVNATTLSQLQPGQAFIVAYTAAGTPLPIKHIEQHRVDVFENGTVNSYPWDIDSSSIPGMVTLFLGNLWARTDAIWTDVDQIWAA